MSSETMPGLNTVREWLNEHYNSGLEVYQRTTSVRVTNGSAAHYVDIYLFPDGFVLSGEIYGEIVRKECSLEKDELLATLEETI